MTDSGNYIIADAHVHIHDNFDLNRLFLVSLQNFRNILKNDGIHSPFFPLLLLTESRGMDKFQELKSLIDSTESNYDFHVTATEEDSSLLIHTAGGQQLAVISGRQVVTAEKLEVLTLGLHNEFPDGRPLDEVVSMSHASGCITVIPWGAGKWLGARGSRVNDVLYAISDPLFFLGDNGNRPSFWKRDETFFAAESKGIYNLPGSDPLPFAEMEKKAGASGFYLPGTLDMAHPLADLKQQLTAVKGAFTPFTTTEKGVPFFKHQILMQLKKRVKK